jgi:diguanylate cyclase (GGDEF)-like protein
MMKRVGFRRGGVVLLMCVAAAALTMPAGATTSTASVAGQPGTGRSAGTERQLTDAEIDEGFTSPLVHGLIDAIEAIMALCLVGAVGFAVRGAFAVRDARPPRSIDLPETDVLLIAEIDRALAESSDVDEVTTILARDVAAFGGAERVAVVMTGDHGGIDRVTPGSADDFADGDVLTLAPVLTAIEARTPRRWVEIDEDRPADPGRSFMVAPIVADGSTIGVVIGGRGGDEPFRLAELDVLCRLGSLASAAIDRLTTVTGGIRDRRRLDADLMAALDAHAGSVGFVMIDVDHLDRFGTAHGDEAAAELLVEVGRVLESNVRDGDVVYRFSDEQFSVLLPDADEADTAEIAERLRSSIESHDFDGADAVPGARITISVGTTVAGDDAPSQVTETADRGLDEARQQGRNRVVVGERG